MCLLLKILSELILFSSNDVHSVLNYYNNFSSFTFLFNTNMASGVQLCVDVVFTLLPGVAGITDAMVYTQ